MFLRSHFSMSGVCGGIILEIRARCCDPNPEFKTTGGEFVLGECCKFTPSALDMEDFDIVPDFAQAIMMANR